MSTNQHNIDQIQAYLSGKLDAKAMHALERQAQSDPFLMDALEGYQETGKDQQNNLNDISARFNERTTTQAKRPVILWRVLPVAATVLLALAAGLIWFKPKVAEQHMAVTVPAAAHQYTKVVAPPVAEQSDKTRSGKIATDKSITGTVTDPTGHALAGVKVNVKGTKLKSVTDKNGVFSIASDLKKGTLNVAYSGYDNKHIRLNGRDSLKVVLNESTNELASVSVTAFVDDDKPANKTHPTIGWKAFRDYIKRNAHMPDGETGLVKLAFTVGADGMINGIRVIHGDNDEMNKRAIDLVLNGPVWKGINSKETRLKIQFRKGKES